MENYEVAGTRYAEAMRIKRSLLPDYHQEIGMMNLLIGDLEYE